MVSASTQIQLWVVSGNQNPHKQFLADYTFIVIKKENVQQTANYDEMQKVVC